MKLTQRIWETWFIASFIGTVAIIFIGTLDGSNAITVYPYVLVLSLINFLVCLYQGSKESKEEPKD